MVSACAAYPQGNAGWLAGWLTRQSWQSSETASFSSGQCWQVLLPLHCAMLVAMPVSSAGHSKLQTSVAAWPVSQPGQAFSGLENQPKA